jgi:hypothetical protein
MQSGGGVSMCQRNYHVHLSECTSCTEYVSGISSSMTFVPFAILLCVLHIPEHYRLFIHDKYEGTSD